MFLLLGACFVLATAAAVLASRGLVADGAFYFITLLSTLHPTTFEHGRLAAHALTQWPTVLALHLGLTDLVALRLIHSLGLFYLGPLQLLLCWWFVPKGKEQDLLWPMLSLFAGSINAWLVIMTEAHVLTWLFWPLLMFVIHGEIRQRVQTLVFAGLAIASALAYEMMALQGMLLAVLAIRRRQEARASERLLWNLVAVWFLLGAGIGVYFGLNPRSPGNRDGFLAGLFQFAGTSMDDLNFPVLLSFGILLAVAGLLLLGPVRRGVFWTVLAGAAGAGILVGTSPIFRPESVRVLEQFQARAWITLLPVGLALLMLLLRRRPPQATAVKMALALVVVLGLSQLTWQVLATAQWAGYVRVFRDELVHHTGLVDFESSQLARDRIGTQPLRTLTWNYTNPLMSIVLAPSGRVSSIITVPRGMWQPFDPADPAALPKLDRYGVDYSAYLGALRPR